MKHDFCNALIHLSAVSAVSVGLLMTFMLVQ